VIFGRLKLRLAAAGAFIVALGLAYMKGRSAKGREVEHERLHDYKETRGRMDEVGAPDNAVAARKWLADRMRDRG
jgi:hypothetical protein